MERRRPCRPQIRMAALDSAQGNAEAASRSARTNGSAGSKSARCPRALSFPGNKDTLFRIHGTNEPDSIGKAVSSGCIRMMNADVIDLYQRVDIGTKVVVM